jgi:hypothetical protein
MSLVSVARIGRRQRIPSPWSGRRLLLVAGNRWPFRLCGLCVPLYGNPVAAGCGLVAQLVRAHA